jgi:hypothetical protein
MRDPRVLKRSQAKRNMERKFLRWIVESTPNYFYVTVDGSIKFIISYTHSLIYKRIDKDIAGIYSDKNEWRKPEERNFVSWWLIKIKRYDNQSKSMLLNAF